MNRRAKVRVCQKRGRAIPVEPCGIPSYGVDVCDPVGWVSP
jgi:hypothetical protein